MRYQVLMHQVVVFSRDRDGAERVIRQVLEEKLEGPEGVVEACLAAPLDLNALTTSTSARHAAASRWWAAVDAALEAVHARFPALMLQLDGDELAEALERENVSVQPLLV